MAIDRRVVFFGQAGAGSADETSVGDDQDGAIVTGMLILNEVRDCGERAPDRRFVSRIVFRRFAEIDVWRAASQSHDALVLGGDMRVDLEEIPA